MATTIIPIEIATLLHAAIAAIVPSGTYVYARGVRTDEWGTVNDNASELKRVLPMVDIIPSERVPQQHASVLRSYPVRVRVITYGPDDPWQVDLYTIGNAVGEYLAGAPALAMTLAEFDALVVDDAPDVGNAGQNDALQYMEWSIRINTRKAT